MYDEIRVGVRNNVNATRLVRIVGVNPGVNTDPLVGYVKTFEWNFAHRLFSYRQQGHTELHV